MIQMDYKPYLRGQNKFLSSNMLWDANKKIDVFEKVRRIREYIDQHLPEIEGDRLIHMLAHCRVYWEGKFYYGRRTADPEIRKTRKLLDLTKTEAILYDLLIKSGLNPSTIYRYFLAARVPEDLMKEVRMQRMSVRKAMEINANRKRVRNNRKGWEMLEEIRSVIRKL